VKNSAGKKLQSHPFFCLGKLLSHPARNVKKKLAQSAREEGREVNFNKWPKKL
jgi:hypothetical protein